MSVDRSGILQPGNYQIVTSGSRPATPYIGQMIYETDTQLFYIYNGSGWAPIGASDENNILAWTGL